MLDWHLVFNHEQVPVLMGVNNYGLGSADMMGG